MSDKTPLSGLLQSDLLAGLSLSLRKTRLSLSWMSPGNFLPVSSACIAAPLRCIREAPFGFPGPDLGEHFAELSLPPNI